MMKKTLADYTSIIKQMKADAQQKNWLYIEINAYELNQEIEPKVSNIKVAAQAMLDEMLEGDIFIITPKLKSNLSKDLRLRYYCDNLDPSRKTYKEVMM